MSFAREYLTAISRAPSASRPGEDTFYFLMGLIHVGKECPPAARRWRPREEEVAAADAPRRTCSSEVDALLRSGRGSRR